MIKKVVFIAALVTLLVAPFVIQSLKATPYTWGCYSFTNCHGTYQCSGDVMESPSRCRFRCKTGETYTVFFQCLAVSHGDPIEAQLTEDPEIKIK